MNIRDETLDFFVQRGPDDWKRSLREDPEEKERRTIEIEMSQHSSPFHMGHFWAPFL